VVSPDARNRHERATTVLVIPLSTAVHKLAPAHMLLRAGETGLRMDCAAQADNIAVVLRSSLREPGAGQRALSLLRFANSPPSHDWPWAVRKCRFPKSLHSSASHFIAAPL